MKIMKKLIALLLSAVMVLSMAPIVAFAEESDPQIDAVYAPAVTVDGIADEADWLLHRPMSGGDNKFDLLWNSEGLYIAAQLSADETLTVLSNGETPAGLTVETGSGVAEAWIPMTISDYGQTAELAITAGSASWSGTVGVSSMERSATPFADLHFTAEAAGEQVRQAKSNTVPLLGEARTSTLEFDFTAVSMPVTEAALHSAIWPCEGFVAALIDFNKYGYVTGIFNTEDGLMFCNRNEDQSITTVELGRELGDTFHIRLDWAMDGTLQLFRDTELLHTFPNTRTQNPYGNVTNMALLEIFSPAGGVTGSYDFTVSNIRMGYALESVLETLSFAHIAGENKAASYVTEDLNLMTNWTEGQLADVGLVWSSSHPEVIAVDGTVTLPQVETVVTLTAALQADETQTKSFEITVPSIVMEADYAAEVTLDGAKTEAWGTPLTFGVGTGSVAGLWNKDHIWLAVETGDAEAMTLTLGDSVWELTPGTVDQDALTGVWSDGLAELQIALPAPLTEYRQQYALQIELDNGSALGIQAIPLILVARSARMLDITSSAIKSGFNYNSDLNAIVLDNSNNGRQYWFIQNVVDSSKDQNLLQTLCIEKMAVSDGTCTAYHDASGYYFWLNDTTNNRLAWANLYNHATKGLVLRVCSINGGGAYEDVTLGKQLGDTFVLGFNWRTGDDLTTHTDDIIEVTVDGELLASVSGKVCICNCGGSRPVTLNYKQTVGEATKITVSNVCFAGGEPYTSLMEELDAKGVLDALRGQTNVTEPLTLPATFTSEYLGELTLEWTSTDESVLTNDGVPCENNGKTNLYATMILSVGGRKVWSREFCVPSAASQVVPMLEPMQAAFTSEAPTLDKVLSEDGWNLNTAVVYDGTTVMANVGVQWDPENLYLAISKPNANAIYADINGVRVAGTTDEIVEMAIPFADLGLTVENYGLVIPAKFTINSGAAVWEGDLVLTSTDWFLTETGTTRLPLNTIIRDGLAGEQPTASQGSTQLDNGYRMFDLYDSEGNNPIKIRNYIFFGGPGEKNDVYEPLNDRTAATVVEFDVKVDSLPVYTKEEAIQDGGYACCYGLSVVVSDTSFNAFSNIIRYGFFNSPDGLIFTATNSVQNTERQFVPMNREVGDTFRFGLRWELDGGITAYVDGEVIARWYDKETRIQSWGNRSLGLMAVRSTKAAESSSDNIDLTITNIALGKSYGDSLMESLTFDTIRGENEEAGQIFADLILPEKLTNVQFTEGVELIWTSDKPEVLDPATGKITPPAGNGELVTLTAALGEETKVFEVYVLGQNPQQAVQTVLHDRSPATGKAVVTDVYEFVLDYDNRSVVRVLGEKQTVNVIILRDGDGESRLNESNLTVWVSDDNVTYTQVKGFKLLRAGELTYLYDFEAEGKYIKVHSTHYKGEADFIGSLENMMEVSYAETFGGTFANTDTYTVSGDSETRYDAAWTVPAAAVQTVREDKADVRFYLGEELLYHYYDGENFVVRIPEVPAGGVTLTVLSGDADAMDISNKEAVYEVSYGTREVFQAADRFQCVLPDGSLLKITADTNEEGIPTMCLAYTRSYDKGRTWTPYTRIECSDGVLMYAGGITYDPNTGRILCHGIGYYHFVATNLNESECHTRVIYSDDLGETWQLAPIMEYDGDPATYYLSYTDPYVTPSHDGEGENVDLVIPMGVQYNNAGGFCVRVAYSTDAGLTWRISASKIIYTAGDTGGSMHEIGTSESTIAAGVDPEGTPCLVLYARCQFENSDHFIVSYSYDNGVTWVEDCKLGTVYTTNTQPMFHQFGDYDLLVWGGNTVIGGASYQRYPLTVAVSYDGLQTFENMQDLYSRTFLQGMTSGTANNVVNQTIQHIGDTLLVTWANNAGEIIQITVDDFTDYFFRTKGAYDSFESSTVKYEGWSVTAGTAEASTEQAAEGSRSMKLDAASGAVRSIPYLQNGTVSFRLYVEDAAAANMTVELESAYGIVFGKAAPIALRVENGVINGLGLQNGWNTISFDLALTDGEASMTVNGETAALSPDLQIGDYICYVDLTTENACYVDDFTAEDKDPMDLAEEEAPNAEIAGTTMTLGNDLALNFLLEAAKVTGEGLYAEIVHGDKVTVVDQDEWIASGEYVKIAYNGLAAKQMTDEVVITIYDAEGNALDSKTDSIKAYAMRMFGYSEEFDTVLADMLIYGAAAQIQFNYKTDDLANKDMTDEQKACATESITLTDLRETAEGYLGTTLALENNIVLNFFYSEAFVGKTATVSYTDHYGTAHNYEVEITASGNMGKVSVDKLVISDCSIAITVTVDGVSVVDSVESYCARMTSLALGEPLMKFAASARAYFSK